MLNREEARLEAIKALERYPDAVAIQVLKVGEKVAVIPLTLKNSARQVLTEGAYFFPVRELRNSE